MADKRRCMTAAQVADVRDCNWSGILAKGRRMVAKHPKVTAKIAAYQSPQEFATQPQGDVDSMGTMEVVTKN